MDKILQQNYQSRENNNKFQNDSFNENNNKDNLNTKFDLKTNNRTGSETFQANQTECEHFFSDNIMEYECVENGGNIDVVSEQQNENKHETLISFEDQVQTKNFNFQYGSNQTSLLAIQQNFINNETNEAQDNSNLLENNQNSIFQFQFNNSLMLSENQNNKTNQFQIQEQQQLFIQNQLQENIPNELQIQQFEIEEQEIQTDDFLALFQQNISEEEDKIKDKKQRKEALQLKKRNGKKFLEREYKELLQLTIEFSTLEESIQLLEQKENEKKLSKVEQKQLQKLEEKQLRLNQNIHEGENFEQKRDCEIIKNEPQSWLQVNLLSYIPHIAQITNNYQEYTEYEILIQNLKKNYKGNQFIGLHYVQSLFQDYKSLLDLKTLQEVQKDRQKIKQQNITRKQQSSSKDERTLKTQIFDQLCILKINYNNNNSIKNFKLLQKQLKQDNILENYLVENDNLEKDLQFFSSFTNFMKKMGVFFAKFIYPCIISNSESKKRKDLSQLYNQMLLLRKFDNTQELQFI